MIQLWYQNLNNISLVCIMYQLMYLMYQINFDLISIK